MVSITKEDFQKDVKELNHIKLDLEDEICRTVAQGELEGIAGLISELKEVEFLIISAERFIT